MHPSDQQSLKSRVDYLRGVAIFADLMDQSEALTEISKIMEPRTYQPGAPIIKEGETGTEMFLLVEGQASVYKSTPEGDHYKVAILKGSQHACLGEGGLLGGDARSATIKADTVCHCLVLNRTVFEDFGKRHPNWVLPVVSRIAQAMMQRLRKTNNDLMLLYNALVAEIRGQ